MLVMKVGVIAEKITQPANSGFVFCPQYRHLHIPYESNPPQKKKKNKKNPILLFKYTQDEALTFS